MDSRCPHGRGVRPPVFRRVGVSRFICCPEAAERRSDACGLVADPDEHPDEEEGGVQRTVGLDQRADREVVLVRSRIDAEHLPAQDHHDERQPRRDAAERRARASEALAGPRVTDWFETPAPAPTPPPAPECNVDEDDRDYGHEPRDLRGARRPVVAADPTAPGTQRDDGNADDHAVAAHHTGLSQTGGREMPRAARSMPTGRIHASREGPPMQAGSRLLTGGVR